MLQGDEHAFTALYYRYYEPLCKKAYRRIPVEATVEEIVQDVFLTFWKKATTLDPNGNIAAWLYATLRNKILHQLRSEQTRTFYLNKLGQVHQAAEVNGHTLLDLKQREEEIHQIVQSLPPQCKEAFLLSRYENLSYKDIAHRMNISVNTVEKHIGKALNILRGQMKEHDYILLLVTASIYVLEHWNS